MSAFSETSLRGPVAIVGCSRSGTKFTALLAQSAGLDFGHETLWVFGTKVRRRSGGVGYPLAIGYPLALWRRTLREGGYHVLHQVRNPLPTIASMAVHRESFWRRVEPITGPLPPEQPARATAFWLRWNRHCEAMAEWTYRVEDLRPGHPTLDRWCRYMNVREDKLFFPPTDTNAIPPGCKARPHARLARADIEALQDGPAILEMAARYGYEV